jgi:hypothetical protein
VLRSDPVGIAEEQATDLETIEAVVRTCRIGKYGARGSAREHDLQEKTAKERHRLFSHERRFGRSGLCPCPTGRVYPSAFFRR